MDTDLSLLGRQPAVDSLGLESVGVKLDDQSRRVIGGHGGDTERSSVDNIYAIGDVLHVSAIVTILVIAP